MSAGLVWTRQGQAAKGTMFMGGAAFDCCACPTQAGLGAARGAALEGFDAFCRLPLDRQCVQSAIRSQSFGE